MWNGFKEIRYSPIYLCSYPAIDGNSNTVKVFRQRIYPFLPDDLFTHVGFHFEAELKERLDNERLENEKQQK